MNPMTSLYVNVEIERPGLKLDLDFRIDAGEVVALVGPNGAGKSTTLEVIAGLLPATRGEVVLGDTVFERTSMGVRLPPRIRGVALVFQGLALFEHMTVLDNVAYGPRARGIPREQARDAAREWLGRLEIEPLADRSPSQLSGGQAQSVAIARALVGDPDLLLLDEPLSALDALSWGRVREQLREVLAQFQGVTLWVTHALADATDLAARILVLEQGKIVQDAAPAELLESPATPHLRAMIARGRL